MHWRIGRRERHETQENCGKGTRSKAEQKQVESRERLRSGWRQSGKVRPHLHPYSRKKAVLRVSRRRDDTKSKQEAGGQKLSGKGKSVDV
jgi:hypothetical protein